MVILSLPPAPLRARKSLPLGHRAPGEKTMNYKMLFFPGIKVKKIGRDQTQLSPGFFPGPNKAKNLRALLPEMP